MNERLVKWENLGLLAKTPENRKEFVANSLELLIAYLNYVYKEEQDGNFETIMFPIIARIGNEVEFGINDLFSIIDELKIGITDLNFESKFVDVEAIYVPKYCDNKVIELKNK